MLIPLVFILVSVSIAAYSWPSLTNPKSHGFFRFFALEGIAVLVLMNIDGWFDGPLSAFGISSWILLLVSLFFAAEGFRVLVRFGKPAGHLDHTTRLVTVGLYKRVRHPLYGSLILFAWGMTMKSPSVLDVCLAGGVTAILYATAKVEERESVEKFGQEYVAYMKRSRMFIPFVF
ncbi:MAG: isoprenylcysteine carboxylmethyltransferase family protein [Bacteroidota bacterium]|nr:isoprenylcysteine carboxylmethyltransferase family protein [Bacteroidota bacterium]